MPNKKNVTIQEIINFFHFTQVTGDEKALQNFTKDNDINRPGFELMGNFRDSVPSRLVLIGNKDLESSPTSPVLNPVFRLSDENISQNFKIPRL